MALADSLSRGDGAAARCRASSRERGTTGSPLSWAAPGKTMIVLASRREQSKPAQDFMSSPPDGTRPDSQPFYYFSDANWRKKEKEQDWEQEEDEEQDKD